MRPHQSPAGLTAVWPADALISESHHWPDTHTHTLSLSHTHMHTHTHSHTHTHFLFRPGCTPLSLTQCSCVLSQRCKLNSVLPLTDGILCHEYCCNTRYISTKSVSLAWTLHSMAFFLSVRLHHIKTMSELLVRRAISEKWYT